MKAEKQSEITETTRQIIQRKEASSFVKSKADNDSFTPPTAASKQNKALPSNLQSNMEASLGQDFSNVSIHTNSQKAAQMNARAYTQDENVHFAPGEFNPNSTQGQNLIGHEFTHIAQQRAGVVKPTKVLQKGVAINDSKSLENEADTFGKKAVQGETISKYRGASPQHSNATTQAKSDSQGKLSEQLTTALSPVQKQQAGIVQYTLATDLTSSLTAEASINFEGIIVTIRNAPVAERQAVLGDVAVMTLIRSSFFPESVARIMSELMVGSQKWKNPIYSDFYQYFVVSRGTGELPTSASMNCWESIMYAGYLAGQINADWIYDFYDRTGLIAASLSSGAANPTPEIWAALGWNSSLPILTSTGNGNPVPSEGDLIFYTPTGNTIPDHVAVYVGNGEVISLWSQPNNIKSVQRISITALSGDIQFTSPPW
ncbi:uncharacterized protein DUF4157 [Kordia periserrulae]|uniref:Uncharacterized protein DUF4157 n=1 Tax=Kordia periserrulae TaxID=701523 RepID=A0A2T6BZW9_9FLAO|nr:DUF4157 domain-containing protein [Kordia periserrulae]PTX61613.1 uncharacterized protein DUF4157 [Kordia periserrulae]